MADNPQLITDMIAPHLDPGERVIGAMNAQPKGRTTSMAAGGIGSMIGQSQVGKVAKNAEAVGLRVASLMAVVVTNQRLITAKIKVSAMGAVTEIVEVLSALPLSSIQEISQKRFGLGGILSITAVGGDPVKLECRVGQAKALVEAFESAKAGA